MDMIRRELPRTERAGWGRSPYRIEAEEGSPFRGPALSSALLSGIHLAFFMPLLPASVFLPCSSQ
jgi:hypothetical protein